MREQGFQILCDVTLSPEQLAGKVWMRNVAAEIWKLDFTEQKIVCTVSSISNFVR